MFTFIHTKNISRQVLNEITQVCLVSKKNYARVRLVEVGKLERPKRRGDYTPGQLFLHKVFAYRGIVLFSWKALVINRDQPVKKDANFYKSDSTGGMPEIDESKFTMKKRYYYQVLIDSRDAKYTRATSEPTTYMRNYGGNENMYAVPGLDYVCHEDILPYFSTERIPLQHDFLKIFFNYVPVSDPPYLPMATLRIWKHWNDSWLEKSRVIMETTDKVRVTVMPFYLGEKTSSERTTNYFWRYRITVENLGSEVLRIKDRVVRVYYNVTNSLQTLRANKFQNEGVLLSKENPAYQYTSHITLDRPLANAWGSFLMERRDGDNFECKIPMFTLDSRAAEDSK